MVKSRAMKGMPIKNHGPRSTVLECQRVVKVTNPALGLMGPVTFHAAFRVMGDQFTPWLEEVFLKEILPGLQAAVRHGSEGRGEDLLRGDERILAGATLFFNEGSGRAGRILLKHGVPSGVRCLRKLTEAATAGEARGHLASVFGARCGVFSVGQSAAALAYIYQELRLGAPEWSDDVLEEKLLRAAELLSERKVLEGKLPVENVLAKDASIHLVEPGKIHG